MSTVLGIALAALLLILPAHAFAQAGMTGAPLNVCVLPDTGGMNVATLLRHPERFDCTRPQQSYGPGSYWVMSQRIGKPSRPGNPLTVRIVSLWQQGLDLHVLYGDGSVASMYADGVETTRLIQLGAIIERRIPTADIPVERLLWHVRDSANMRGIILAPRLADESQSALSNLAMGSIYAGFAGLCFALIVYNFALWGALRHSFHLAYCAMATLLLVYAFSSSGALAWAFPDIPNNLRLRINYLTLFCSAAAAFIFARTFFEPRVFEGIVGKMLVATAAMLVLVGGSFFLFSPYAVRPLDQIATGAFVVVSIMFVPMFWRIISRRSSYLWLFCLAWSGPVSTVVLRALGNMNLIAWNFWLDNSTLLAMAAEAMMSSLAIAYRIHILRGERDEAVANEAIARRLADIDPLTGLLNRRAFLAKAIGRQGEQMLLIADLDHFKRVNETLGHDGGDEVLRVFARALRQIVPAGALVARLGGEEFAIVTATAEPVEADAVLERLRTTRMPFDLTVTASIGTCSGPLADEVDWKRLYRGADAALFEAKSSGRDRARAAPHARAA